MQPIITPPTDNIYKFVALTGVVLFLTSIIFPLRLFYELRSKEIQFQADSAAGKATYETWIASEALLEKDRKRHDLNLEWLRRNLENNPHPFAPDDLKKFQADMANKLDEETDRFMVEHAKNVERAAAADAAIGAARSKAAELDFLKWSAFASLVLFGVIACVGIGMAWRGFYLWQTRVQVHQDAILRADALAKSQTHPGP